jgi:hypothetical protein
MKPAATIQNREEDKYNIWKRCEPQVEEGSNAAKDPIK